MLTHETVSLEKRKNNLCFSLRHFSDLGDVRQLDRLIDGILLERQSNSRCFLDLRIASAKEVCLNPAVFYAVEHGASCRQSIASRATGFLVIRFDRSRKVIMHHEANVLLVDSQTECIRRDDRLQLVNHERVLNSFALC